MSKEESVGRMKPTPPVDDAPESARKPVETLSDTDAEGIVGGERKKGGGNRYRWENGNIIWDDGSDPNFLSR